MGAGSDSPSSEPVAARKAGKRKGRKKRRKKAAVDDRPGFARAYPRDPALDGLLIAFQAGNFAAVRRGTAALVENGEDPAVIQAARDLRRRIHAGPTAIYLWVISALLLAFLAGYYWLQGH